MEPLERISSCSNYLATLIRRSPESARWLIEERNLYRRYPVVGLYQSLLDRAAEAADFAQLLHVLRDFKQLHFLRIGARDLLGLADLAETTGQVSDLACVSLQVGLNILSGRFDMWAPELPPEVVRRVIDEFPLSVLGLGKLGGHELNYVSDVDLIYLHMPGRNNDTPDPDALTILNRLCQRLSRLLSDRAEGDRVFEVDLRLRPLGKDGPLVPSVAMALDHYMMHGRPWERQMLLKARPVAGDRSLGMAFIQEVRPFVFRRFLDFQAIDELKLMRDRILAEAVRPAVGWRQFDVKLGIGGIREIEFLTQCLQLVYGGRHPRLDEPNTLKCLEQLMQLELLDPNTVSELKDAYVFLRRVEHWVQLDQNRQTQKLPQSEEARARLHAALGFEGDERGFLSRLEACCMNVHGHFGGLFTPSRTQEGGAGGVGDESHGKAADIHEAFPPDLLNRFGESLKKVSPTAAEATRAVLHRFAGLKDQELREKALIRLERYFSQVSRRPGLAKVFQTDKPWVVDLCEGIARSELLADLLGHHPGLAEGVATVGGECLDLEAWEVGGNELIERAGDLEEAMEWLRRLKNERILQLAIEDLSGKLSHERLELLLTALADFVVRHTYHRIRGYLKLDPSLPLVVLGLGKMGSREMGYLSDLDLAFVYDPGPGESQDQIPMDIVRFVQRFMRMLSIPLADGPGYSVDARLRPTGNYGPLIVTRSTWIEYYQEQADIWELQALLRARFVAGHAEMGRWLEAKAQGICFQDRNGEEVWGRICHLRGRMQRERADEKHGWIDLKLGYGGTTDLEFLTQGYQLVHGKEHSELRGSSVRRLIETVACRALEDPAEARELTAFYSAFRSLEHRLGLYTNQSGSRLTPFHLECMSALGLWPISKTGGTLENWEDVLRARRRIRKSLLQFCPDL